MAESVGSLVERLLRISDWIGEQSRGHRLDMSALCSEMRQDVREAASRLAEGDERGHMRGDISRLCQSEGPRGETICMMPLGHEGPCGWERQESLIAARQRTVSETIDSLQDGGWLKPADADYIRATLRIASASPASTSGQKESDHRPSGGTTAAFEQE